MPSKVPQTWRPFTEPRSLLGIKRRDGRRGSSKPIISNNKRLPLYKAPCAHGIGAGRRWTRPGTMAQSTWSRPQAAKMAADKARASPSLPRHVCGYRQQPLGLVYPKGTTNKTKTRHPYTGRELMGRCVTPETLFSH